MASVTNRKIQVIRENRRIWKESLPSLLDYIAKEILKHKQEIDQKDPTILPKLRILWKDLRCVSNLPDIDGIEENRSRNLFAELLGLLDNKFLIVGNESTTFGHKGEGFVDKYTIEKAE